MNSQITNEKTKIENLEKHGVYSLKGVENESSITIESMGIVEIGVNDGISDTPISRYEVMPNVFGEIYTCNIIDKFLLSSKTQPLLYISVSHEKAVFKSFLFKIGVYFTILSEVTSESQLLNHKLNGKFTTEIEIENKSKTLNEEIQVFTSNEKITNNLIEFTKSDAMKEIIKELVISNAKERARRMGFINNVGTYQIPKIDFSYKNI